MKSSNSRWRKPTNLAYRLRLSCLLPKALAQVRACAGHDFDAADAVVIGDTPLDVACATAGGARSIGVATGSHGVEELREAGADVVFRDLADLDAVLRALFADN